MTLEPSRISLARMRAGLTMTELSRRLDVTLRTVQNYETLGAPKDAQAALALALGCPSSYLEKDAAAPLREDAVYFRARRRTSARERHRAESVGRSGIELYELLSTRFVLPSRDLPDLSPFTPEEAAFELRQHWGLGVSPIPNSIQLAESRGIRVLALPGQADDVDAFSVWEGGAPYVFLSTRKSSERSRFDMAHEIGHLVMHGSLDSDAERRAVAEKEADAFASAFLLPREVLLGQFCREPAVPDVLAFKKRYGVSAMALAYALNRAGLYSEWGYRRTCQQLTSAGYRSGEPGGLPRERSRIFPQTLPALTPSGRPDARALQEQLGISAEDLHELTFGHALLPASGAQERSASSARTDRWLHPVS